MRFARNLDSQDLIQPDHPDRWWPQDRGRDDPLWSQRVANECAAKGHHGPTGLFAKTRGGPFQLRVRLLHDETGQPMTPTHAVKNGKRYRYSISRGLLTQSRLQVPGGRRIPAGDIEALVVDRLRTFQSHRSEVHDALEARIPDAAEQEQLIERAVELGRN